MCSVKRGSMKFVFFSFLHEACAPWLFKQTFPGRTAYKTSAGVTSQRSPTPRLLYQQSCAEQIPQRRQRRPMVSNQPPRHFPAWDDNQIGVMTRRTEAHVFQVKWNGRTQVARRERGGNCAAIVKRSACNSGS